MQDNKNNNNINPEAQNNAASFITTTQTNELQTGRNFLPKQEERTSQDLSEMDQQEGNMNNGVLGGNFAKEEVDVTFKHNSPPY